MEIVNVVSEKVNDFEDYVRKSNPPPFLVKTYMMVDDGSSDAVISWNADGTAFIVWQPAEFARDVLPTLFKHSNFSSFVRQLNTYGFRKVATSRWEFCNDLFQRGKKDLLCRIRRRKAWAHRPPPTSTSPSTNNEATTPNTTSEEDRRSSSTSSSSETTNLADENKRLKMENGILTSELSSMKDKCQELIDLVALYSTSTATATKEIETKKREVADDDDERLMLFGVRLDVKRKRSTDHNHKLVAFVHSQSCKS